jgi:hypothetical protein
VTLNQLVAIVAIFVGVIALTLTLALALLPRWANAQDRGGKRSREEARRR